ncbi:MAG: three-Cys-motif partner protein TcmP [Syntrophobacteraceae bacterium]
MPIPASYHGREQALVKHYLLETYLQRLFMIIGLHQKSIRYVDCFSGPWQQGSTALQDTSIGISLKIIEKSREGLKRLGKDVTFHALFIEKNKVSFRKLQDYLTGFPRQEVSTEALHGDFFELRNLILEWCGSEDFTFFFIDPTGWKKVVEIPTLAPLLRRQNSEFLINFMYDFLLRTHTQVSFSEDIQAIFGEVPDTAGLTPVEKEEYLITQYQKRLKEISPAWGGRPRVVSVPVLYPTIDRTLYHLVYLTRQPKGITVFMEAAERLELVQRRAREDAKQEDRELRSRQREMFSASSLIGKEKRAVVSEVKPYWLNRLSPTPFRFGIEELADMIEETGWFESDFQVAFHELEREGRVKNLDATGKRRTRFIHFTAQGNKGELLVRKK